MWRAADYLTPMSGESARTAVSHGPHRPGRDNAVLNWLFRNRRTGEITVFQAPNLALGTFLVAFFVNRLFNPSGTAGTVLTVVQTGALAIWAVDELARGVNPFRRMLGGAFLVGILASLTF
jgi:hypothetical protein